MEMSFQRTLLKGEQDLKIASFRANLPAIYSEDGFGNLASISSISFSWNILLNKPAHVVGEDVSLLILGMCTISQPILNILVY